MFRPHDLWSTLLDKGAAGDELRALLAEARVFGVFWRDETVRERSAMEPRMHDCMLCE